ncbi:MAG TPA: GNAT family N-acetyltransferase [Actinomycetota bacterium]|nr:GNAT family N-acetyltransferase [Actinomycetota bacterium]
MTTLDPEFIRKRTTEVVLADGTRAVLRPLVPEDGQRIIDGFARMSPESRYRRFMSPVDELSPEMLRKLTEVDYVDHFAWAALAADEPGRPGIGVARYVRCEDDPEVAEAAVTVIDEYQGRGLGTLLLQALGAAALEHGITRFRGFVLEENRAMREILEELGARTTHEGAGLVRVEVNLPIGADVRSSPAYRALRALARGEAPKLLRWGALWERPRG